MLNLTNLALTSPPAAVQPTGYRPAVSFRNEGDQAAYITGTLSIKDVSTGRTIYSDQLHSGPVAAGATSLASAGTDWYPTPGGTFLVEASLFAGNADVSASATLSPVVIASVGATPTPLQHLTAKIDVPGAAYPIFILVPDADKERPPVIQYPFYLNF